MYWQKEYLGYWTVETPEHKELRELAKLYAESTEEYDKSVCSFINKKNIAMPSNLYEFSLINKNARKVMDYLMCKVKKLGFNKKEFLEEIKKIK